ncbi:MAG: hypothetical protein AAFO74_12845 [Pseudomonadota bacterium]
MFQLTDTSPERPEFGSFYLVTQSSEHGPFESYEDAVDAAEHPYPEMIGFNPRRGYFVVDRSEPNEN